MDSTSGTVGSSTGVASFPVVSFPFPSSSSLSVAGGGTGTGDEALLEGDFEGDAAATFLGDAVAIFLGDDDANFLGDGIEPILVDDEEAPLEFPAVGTLFSLSVSPGRDTTVPSTTIVALDSTASCTSDCVEAIRSTLVISVSVQGHKKQRCIIVP